MDQQRCRNDDAIGVFIAESLQKEGGLNDHLTVFNVEDVIENYVFQIADANARNVLLVDAVEIRGATTGSVVFGRLDDFSEARGEFSTHKLALSTAAKILEAHGKTVYLLGLVADNIDYGTEISGEIMTSALKVIDTIRMARSV